MEFHIPYYVWAKAKYVPRDKRVRPDKSSLRKKSALRKSILLSFLTKPRATAEEGDILDCLHEAQWSCVVVGYNNTVWNGYGLTDTYFYDADSPFDRTTFRYFQDDDLLRDPISGLEANLPVQNPREYFLTALRARVKDIKEEWEHIISRLGQEMEYFVSKNRFEPSLFNCGSSHFCFKAYVPWTDVIYLLPYKAIISVYPSINEYLF